MDLTPELEKAAQRAFKNISARFTKVRMSKKEFEKEVLAYLIEECGLDEDDYDAVDAAYARIVTLMGDRMPTNAPPQPPPPANTSKGSANLKPRPKLSQHDQKAIDDALNNIPYCFIPLSEKVVYAPATVTPRKPNSKNETEWTGVMDAPLPRGLSGSITLDWVFETPMLIGEKSMEWIAGEREEKDVATPFKLGDTFAIPGATLRGHIRHLMETITAARLTKLNRHHRYGVRDFEHPLFKREGEDGPLSWGKLGSGWLQKIPASEEEKAQKLSDYVITPCEKKLIRIRALPEKFTGAKTPGERHMKWLTSKLNARYIAAGYQNGSTLDFETASKASFFTSDGEVVPKHESLRGAYVKPSEKGERGWYVFSNNSPSLGKITAKELDDQQLSPKQGDQKKYEVIFLETPHAQPVRLKQAVWDTFVLINSKPSKNSRKPDGSWKVMEPTVEAGKRIPVFFAGELDKQDEKTFGLGLTRLFKMPHENGVQDILYRVKGADVDEKGDCIPLYQPNPEKPDMVEALFGHVYEPDEVVGAKAEKAKEGEKEKSKAPAQVARKGRVAFGFAMLNNEETPAKLWPECGDNPHQPKQLPLSAVMMGPRASYAPFYLSGPVKDWTDKGQVSGQAHLAGRKSYFPRFEVGTLGTAASQIKTMLEAQKGNGKDDAMSNMRFLVPEDVSKPLRFTGEIRVHNVLPEELGALLYALTFGGDATKRHMIGRAKPQGAGQARVENIQMRLESNDDDKPIEPTDYKTHIEKFETYMQEHIPQWPKVAEMDVLMKLATPSLRYNKDLPLYPELKTYGNIKKTVKAITGMADPSDEKNLLKPRL